ncbi:hypothetical protein K466DRAFT_522882 [Polyporus arcularius HHB13444]|uniref:DUF4139 domain-containing protein n=1 Tax=Polyporus arcularius HHB13444 TaxID=1314778 RepID=A0A5C3PMF5_9APHY|nr:hypothetical protein K466DRAFT_522882 [Polyporus arcularius HHB13444]
MSSTTIALNAAGQPVQAVTIFQSSSAELTRTFTINLTGGRNMLEITSLSSRVDTQSPRIHGLGSDARVFDISCDTQLTDAPGPRPRKNADAVKNLEMTIKTLEIERNVHLSEYDMLDNAPKSLANGTPTTEMDVFMDRFVQRKLKAMKAVMACDGAIESLNKELWLLNNASKGETAGRVIATILAKRPCTVTFQLTYLVTGVSWQPYYDLLASTSEGKPSSEVSLLYCANITQNTGEDWTDTVLTLSTANSQALRNLSVPVLDPLKVSPQAPAQPPLPVVPSTGIAATVQPGSTDLIASRGAQANALALVRERHRAITRMSMTPESANRDHALNPPAPPAPPTPPAIVHYSPLSLSYHVEGPVTLMSDGVAHRVSIAMLDFKADLRYVCVPRKNTAAFIVGTIKNSSEYELLAGPVSVFMDAGFVTKTSFNLIGVNESFNCVLGSDTALRVTYTQQSRTEHEAGRTFDEPTKTTTRMITIAATNGHTFDIPKLVIRDAIPLGDENANIKVMLRKPEGLAQAKDGEEVTVLLKGEVQNAKARWSKLENGKGGEKDGMYEWVCSVPAGKAVSLKAEWAVKAPSNVKWEETINMGGPQKD